MRYVNINNMKNLVKNNAILIAGSILFIISLLFSWYMGLIAEDVFHFSAESFQEAYDIATQSRNNTNTRIGELSMYFVGISPEGTGTVFALWLYRLINPISIVACTFFIYRLGTGTWPTNTKAGLISFALVIFCMLSNKTNHYWFCGNLSWFYPTVIAMLFFIMIEPFFKGKKISTGCLFTALCCVPIMGMSNESVSITALLLYGLAGYLYMKKNATWKINKQYLIIGIILLAFTILFYTAPGPYKRAHGEYSEISKIEFAIRNFFSANWLHVLFWCWRLILISIAIFILCPLKKWNNSRNYVLISAFLMLGGILMLAPNFGAPRSLIPVELILMAILCGVIYRTVQEKPLTSKKLCVLFLMLIGLAITILIPNTVRSIDNARFYALLQHKANEVIVKGEDQLIIKDKDIYQESIWSFSRFRIPKTLLEIYPIYTHIKPIVTTTQECYDKSEFKHQYALFPYSEGLDLAGTDLTLNRGLAKYVGLKAIIVIRSEAEDKK